MLFKKIVFFLFLYSFGTSCFSQAIVSPKDSIRILSWNIQMLPDFYSPFSKYVRKKQKKRLPEIIKYLNEGAFEIIVLQEVFDLNSIHKLKNQLKEQYPYQQLPKKKGIGIKLSNGIMVLSKFPLDYIKHITFDKTKGNERLAQKGCVLTSFSWNNKTIYLAGTHLNSLSQEARRAQYKAIYEEIVSPFAFDTTSFFLAGDFNTNFNSKYYNEMISTIQLINPILNEKSPFTYASANSWNAPKYNVWIDFILHNQTTNMKITRQSIIRPAMQLKEKKIDLSDHYGIAITVRFNQGL